MHRFHRPPDGDQSGDSTLTDRVPNRDASEFYAEQEVFESVTEV